MAHGACRDRMPAHPCPSSDCLSCHRASSSATASKSFGRPTARLTRISASSVRHRQLTPKRSNTIESARRILVAAAARHLAEEIQLPEVGGQREIQPGLERRHVQPKGQSRRRTAKIRVQRSKGRREPLEVRARTRIDDIHIPRRPDGAVCVGGEAADEDVLDAAGGQRLQEPLEVGHWPVFFAASLSLSVKRVSSTRRRTR